jgi:hypothetical protein
VVTRRTRCAAQPSTSQADTKRALIDMIRKNVRTGGGDVQTVIGG